MKLDKAQVLLDEQPISIDVLLEKYAKGDEQSVDDVRRRVARALAGRAKRPRAVGDGASTRRWRSGFIPGGPHQLRRRHAAAGDAHQLLRAAGGRLHLRDRRRQAGHLHRAAWRPPRPCAAAAASATTSRRSAPRAHWCAARTRARAARCPTCACSTSAARQSNRPARGAARRWAMLRCDHPDVEEFIHAKDQGDLRNFNVSWRHRRLHAGRGGGRRLGAGAQGAARP